MHCGMIHSTYSPFLKHLDHSGLTLNVARRGCRKIKESNEGAELSGHDDSTLSLRARSARSAKSNYSRKRDEGVRVRGRENATRTAMLTICETFLRLPEIGAKWSKVDGATQLGSVRLGRDSSISMSYTAKL